MIYTIDELKEKVSGVAAKYQIKAVYLFGSYANGDAREDSNVNLIAETPGSISRPALAQLFCELEEALKKEVDLMTVSSFDQSDDMLPGSMIPGDGPSLENIRREMIALYIAE